MSFIRRLDTSYKLFACFVLLTCCTTALSLWLLGQQGQLSALIAVPVKAGPKLGAPQALYAGAQVWTWFAISASAGLSCVLALWLRAEVMRPVRAAADMARRVARGDLSSRIDASDGAAGSGALLASMQDMNDKLVEMVVKVRAGTESIAGSAAGIAAGGMDLSARSEAHTAALEHTASSFHQFSDTVRQHDHRAQQARALAGSASETALRGGAQVAAMIGEVAATIAALDDSARRIAQLTSVVDAIAFQTKLLALSAAVEAARAGEQGRAFARVASGVGDLAQRSAAAAGEIKLLADASAGRAASGAALAGTAGVTMVEVMTSLQRARTILGELAGAEAELDPGVEQVKLAIAALERATRHTTRLVEQTTAAGAAIRDEAGSLARASAAFSLGETYAPTAVIHLVSSNPNKLIRQSFDRRGRAKLQTVPVQASAPSAAPCPVATPVPSIAAMRNRANARRDLDWEEF